MDAERTVAGARFVDPKVLARIGSLELLARTVVDGFINGLHKAPYLGVSIDFAEHRGYMPGDDIRFIDWRVFARTDRFYVKQFEADTNANFSVMFDVSRSMSFGSKGLTKLDYGRYLAACLTYFCTKQRDRVGLVTFDEDIVRRVPPSAKHLDVVLHELDRIEAGRPGSLERPLFRATEFFKRRGIIVVISDFYEDPKRAVDMLKPLSYGGNDLIVFQILDPAEIDFPYDEATSFQDLETGRKMPVVPEKLREQYRQLVQEHIVALSKLCGENRIDYALFNTATPLDHALFKFLAMREKLTPSALMGFLAPLVFLGLATLAVPVIIHMIQRERKEVVEFPSLMFIRKIPFHSFRRQRIRNWFLLLLRCAAIALLLAAFARPFFRAAALAAVTSTAREVVILLDRSYSMGYDDRWDRARAAASDVVNELGPEDRATVIYFDSGAEAGPRSTTDRATLLGLIGSAEVGSGSTRYGPALKLAEGVFEDSDLPQLEVVLVSDFQRSGVESASGVRFPQGTVLTPIAVTSGEAPVENVSVAGVLFDREYFSGRERVSVAARVTNRGMDTVGSLDVSLEIDGREIETVATELPANGSSTVSFAPVTIGDRPVTGTVRTQGDQLPTDDVFHFVMSPGQVVTVLIVGNDRGASDSALYLSRALGIGSSPAFDVTTTTISSFDTGDLAGRQVVVLNDTPPPTGQAAAALEQFVNDGGGLMVVAGERSTWPADGPDLLPGTFGSPVDRTGRGAGLGFVDYSHPVFELFGAPRSGDVTTARFFRYRPMEPADSATVLARFDDGNPALLERQSGNGRVLFWASTLDNFWNDLALKAVYLPFVHRLAEHLADYAPPTPWVSAGQVLNLADQRSLLTDAGLAEAELVAISPSGDRIQVSEGVRAGFLTMAEQGIYEIHDATTTSEYPLTLAVNVDLAESDLTAIDPDELASSLTGRVAVARGDVPAEGEARAFTSEDLERRQGVWWYLLVAVFALFVSETVLSNRLSRTALNVD